MEAWYSEVRKLRDVSEDSKLTRDLCFHIYHDLIFIKLNRKLKEKQKFRERKGAEFDSWTTDLAEGYGSELISEVISTDDFWNETLKVVSF